MALKDWKQDELYLEKWSKKNDTIEIITNHDKNMKPMFYTVEIFLFEKEDEVGKWLRTRRFSSKALAINHAKQYMRSH